MIFFPDFDHSWDVNGYAKETMIVPRGQVKKIDYVRPITSSFLCVPSGQRSVKSHLSSPTFEGTRKVSLLPRLFVTFRFFKNERSGFSFFHAMFTTDPFLVSGFLGSKVSGFGLRV